ncbi:hypothetical protein B9Z55_000673 [Caenorhabditis nigoni]|nr:hypothetical protein B9Z55_000673 [Caenorhabditis nigoni]
MYLDGYLADVRNFEKFFSSSPVAKIILLRVLKKMEPLNPESKVYQAEGVNVHTPRIMGPDFLRHFQGKQIGLYCRIHEKSSFIDLVNRWKSGKAFQNLEGVYVQMIDDIPPGILNEVGVKFIDANRQPPTHSVRQRLGWCNKNGTTHPITSHAYVVRETDNRVASVMVSIITFLFGVWDKTEEEFLKMVE